MMRIRCHCALLSAAIFLATAGCCTGLQAQAAQTLSPPPGLETGTFHLHKFAQAIGTETYTIADDGKSLVLDSKFNFTDRGTRVSLSATLRMQPNLTPQRFTIKGNTSRLSSIDTEIDIVGTKATMRQGKQPRAVDVPGQYFTLSGYAPAAMQMMLMRYWLLHGRPASLPVLPGSEPVRIERRGSDTVSVDGKSVKLERYGLTGVIWGRETLWLNRERQLVALVTCDAEFDHFEALREGYEAGLSQFISRAAQDNSKALTQRTRHWCPPRKGTIALIGGTLIDGTDSLPMQNVTILVEGDRIMKVGRVGQVTIPRGAIRVDARGKTILPGLWDMHAHYEQVEWGPIYLAAGVTTVRDCGNEFDYITAVRDVLKSGQGIGPQLILAGLVDGDGPEAIGIVRINTPEQAREVIQRYKDSGFAQIKIYSSIKPELVPMICAEAHRQGLSVTGHIPDGMNAMQGVEAGMDQINHIAFLLQVMADRSKPGSRYPIDFSASAAQQALQTLKAHQTVIDPTLVFYELPFYDGSAEANAREPDLAKVAPQLSEPLRSAPLPPAIRPRALAARAAMLSIVATLHRNGIPVVAGTDQIVPGHSLHRELELYVEAGLTPMEAIQAATIVPARAMHMEAEVGTLEVGKRADLILVDGSPLEAIRNIRKVRFVMSAGSLYECAPLWRSVGFQP